MTQKRGNRATKSQRKKSGSSPKPADRPQGERTEKAEGQEHPKVKCIGCKKDFAFDTDDMLQCEMCTDSWLCRPCMNMSKDTYKFLHDRNDLPWFCPDCHKKIQNMIETDRKIEDACKEYMKNYESRLEKIEDKLETKADKTVVDETSAKVIHIETQILGLAKDISALNSKMNLVRTEPNEKEKRTKNLIIRGLPEVEGKEDLDLVKSILKDIGCEDVKIDQLTRLSTTRKTENRVNDNAVEGAAANAPEAATTEGTETDNTPKIRHKPIKVILESEEMKRKVLKNAPKVRNIVSDQINPKEIWIVPDQTRLERQVDLELRRKLKERKRLNPEKSWKIQKGKIVEKPTTQ